MLTLERAILWIGKSIFVLLIYHILLVISNVQIYSLKYVCVTSTISNVLNVYLKPSQSIEIAYFRLYRKE